LLPGGNRERWNIQNRRPEMNILFVVPYMPNLIRARSYNLTRFLARMGHQVKIATLWTDEHEMADKRSLESYSLTVDALGQPKWRSALNCLIAVPSRTPLQAVYSWNPGLARRLSELAQCNGGDCFDVIHVEHLRGARYGEYIKSRFPDIPVVWDSVDCISYLFEQASGKSRSIFSRLLVQFELKRTRKYEGELPGKFDHILITSQVDRQALLGLAAKGAALSPVSVLPNGVDWEYFGKEEIVSREPATVVFSGKMSYHANITMVLHLMNEIMPYVWEKCPEVRVLIVGKDPPAQIRALAKNPAVVVTGTVDDIRPYLYRATVAVVPLIYGAGIQNKVLEAMACGTPVVATPRAILALDAVPDRDLLIASAPADFAEKVLMLIEDRALQQKVGQSGRQYVEKNHQWARITGLLEGVYHEVIRTRH
jgi:glycosyltransferase involved in cell wall biosynthesis